jgi:hypothetical protein
MGVKMLWTFQLLYLSSGAHLLNLPHVKICQPQTFSITSLQPRDMRGDGCSSCMDDITPTPLPHANLSF